MTMVIPTFNRHHYLKRAIDYYGEAPFSILVVDSTDKEYRAHLPSNFRYIHTKLGFPEKLFEAMGMIKTKYFMLCGDDDFVSFSGVGHCLRFLEKNVAYVAAQGRSIAFKNRRGSIKKSPLSHYARNLDVDSSGVEDRIVRYMNSYVPFIYAVMRTSAVRGIFDALRHCGIREANLIEMGVALGLVIRGKIKMLSVFHSAREKIAFSSGKTYKSILDISTDKLSAAEYSRFKVMLSGMVAQSVDNGSRDSRQIVERGLSVYMNEFYDFRKSIWSRKNRIMKILTGLLNARNFRALLETSITEIEDIDFFFDIVGEIGYPFPWDPRASAEWESMARLIKDHTISINKAL